MIELKNEKIAIPVVLFAGLLWSFGPLVVRYMDNPHMVPWQYIFGRGLTIFIILNLYLYFEEGINFYKNYKKVGRSGVIGGCGLGVAMVSFIYSITNTSAAITLLCLAAMPFFYCNISLYVLKGKNFFKCMGVYFYSYSWNNNYGIRQYREKLSNWLPFLESHLL
ncbi:DMT family transporter [Candidatus Pelagibacter sp.]|nr:DMT family transporter [Candidatus Pelagibacter sp.]